METIRENVFRPLNSMERATILAASTPKKGLLHRSRIPANDARVVDIDSLVVSYERMQGGFTICILLLRGQTVEDMLGEPIDDKYPDLLWRGASRRSYRDARNPVRGEMLAFSRAVLYSRPVTV